MWHDHPFSQRNMTTERTVEMGLEMTERLGEWAKLEKGNIGNIGKVFIK